MVKGAWLPARPGPAPREGCLNGLVVVLRIDDPKATWLVQPCSSNFHCTCGRAQISDVLRLVAIMLEAVSEIRESEFRASSRQLGTKLCSVHYLDRFGIINLLNRPRNKTADGGYEGGGWAVACLVCHCWRGGFAWRLRQGFKFKTRWSGPVFGASAGECVAPGGRPKNHAADSQDKGLRVREAGPPSVACRFFRRAMLSVD